MGISTIIYKTNTGFPKIHKKKHASAFQYAKSKYDRHAITSLIKFDSIGRILIINLSRNNICFQ